MLRGEVPQEKDPAIHKDSAYHQGSEVESAHEPLRASYNKNGDLAAKIGITLIPTEMPSKKTSYKKRLSIHKLSQHSRDSTPGSEDADYVVLQSPSKYRQSLDMLAYFSQNSKGKRRFKGTNKHQSIDLGLFQKQQESQFYMIKNIKAKKPQESRFGLFSQGKSSLQDGLGN